MPLALLLVLSYFLGGEHVALVLWVSAMVFVGCVLLSAIGFAVGCGIKEDVLLGFGAIISEKDQEIERLTSELELKQKQKTDPVVEH